MLKKDVKVIEKKGLCYIARDGNRIKKFKPWLGDAFSFLYDYIMENSIFPKKFGGDIIRHYEIMKEILKDIHGNRVLELATGSGSAINFLPNDNMYTGTDISPGLLKRAVKRFNSAGFKETGFFVASANDLPFEDDYFDLCLCILALNFIGNVEALFQEIKRVLGPEAVFICSVPVPERNTHKSIIRGDLYSEDELASMLNKQGFKLEIIPVENGTLLYFKASLLK